MGNLTISRFIAAPPAKVFAAASDFAHAAEHVDAITRIEMLTDGPVGVGTRFRETRVMFGKEATEEMEVTEFQPPGMYTLRAESCGCRYDSTLRFEPEKSPDGEGTLLVFTMESQPLTLLARLMTPLGWLMSGAMKKMIAKDFDDLKRRLEAAEAGHSRGDDTIPA